MRNVPDSMTQAWLGTNKVSPDTIPTCRATIHRQDMKSVQYDTAWEIGGTEPDQRARSGFFRSFIFGDNSGVREIPNIQTCEWDRSVTQDAASCTLTLLNTQIVPIGQAGDDASGYDRAGALTFNRGNETISQNRWGYDADTGWNGVFVPDMVVRTFEGYGADYTVPAYQDPHLVQTGTWMIDKVTYAADGTITLEMRDLARLLLDQIVFPPAVPVAEYPLHWSKLQSVNVPGRDCAGGAWTGTLSRFGKASSSNSYYVGKGFTNTPYASYVNANGTVDGYSHAFPISANAEEDIKSWRSVGMDSGDDWAWWQYSLNGKTTKPINALRMRMFGGPYRVYISIHNGTKWLGKKKVPYSKNGISGTPGNVDIKADIPFVKSVIAQRNYKFDVMLPRKYHMNQVRLTFTKMRDSHVGEHTYRAGLKLFEIYTGDFGSLKFQDGEKLEAVGNYTDWTQVVKWTCAWGGFFWPPHSTGLDFLQMYSESGQDTRTWVTYDTADGILPKGRVWGDFMKSGTAGTADITVDQFDKQPLFDVISYVRDLLGYLFLVDEYGAVIWRLPNIWSLGNYVMPETAGMRTHTHYNRDSSKSHIVTLDETTNLISYSTVLDSSNIRERIFVANVVGGAGVVLKGFNPYPVGLTRVVGWTDQNFATKQEATVMADLINAQAMFSYKTSDAQIPGYPKIQVDDQVLIYDRLTNETYYHYVMGIKSSLDMAQGTWTYDLSTHWLGEDPSDGWIVPTTELQSATRQYMALMSGDDD